MSSRRVGRERVLRKSVWYPHPVEAVWCALTDSRALAEWLMPNDFEARAGHRFVFKTDPMALCGAGITECEVLELEAPRRMVWSWTHPPKEGKPQRPTMTVAWSLAPEREGTRLTLEQRGLEGQQWWIPKLMSVGWTGFLRKYLRKALANVARDGDAYRFTPGAIPLEKRAYKAKTVEPALLGAHD